MKHLDASEFVDAVDGRLPDIRARHLETCADCRTQAAALAETLGDVRMEPVPEPSPLFWDHLSARIGQALDNEPLPQSPWLAWLPEGRLRVAAAVLALALLATAGGYVGWTWRSLAGHDTPAIVMTDEATAPGALDNDLSGDAWDAIAAAAGDLDLEEAQAAGISARPGSAERVALELTPEEQMELARLLEGEMRRHGA